MMMTNVEDFNFEGENTGNKRNTRNAFIFFIITNFISRYIEVIERRRISSLHKAEFVAFHVKIKII